eukprot:c7040_g1_i1 orf=884-1111(+)
MFLTCVSSSDGDHCVFSQALAPAHVALIVFCTSFSMSEVASMLFQGLGPYNLVALFLQAQSQTWPILALMPQMGP